MKFVLDAPAPDLSKIPQKDVLGVTAILLTCSYNNQEFFRCGYYVNNIYDNDEMNFNQPEEIKIQNVVRSILADKPRITKFNIDWDNETNVIPSYNNYNFMFNEGKENIQNNLFSSNNGQNKNNLTKTEEQMKDLFSNINNNNHD